MKPHSFLKKPVTRIWFFGSCLALGVLFFGDPRTCLAQENQIDQRVPIDTVGEYDITLKDGTKLNGQILERDEEFFTIKVKELGTVRLSADLIRSYVLINANPDKPLRGRRGRVSGGENLFENQFGFKYFFFPTAQPAEPKKLYISAHYYIFSSVSYGINKSWSAGASFLNFGGEYFHTAFTKVTLNPDALVKFAISAQYLGFQNSGYKSVGYFQFIITSGGPRNNFTIGAGKVFSRGDFANGTVATLGLVSRISRKVSIISQNHLILGSLSTSDSFGILIVGARLNRKVNSYDLGLMAPVGPGFKFDTQTPAFPYFGFNLKIGK
jgi:hypothetical protein